MQLLIVILNETLGLEDYTAFLHEPSMADKFDFLMSTNADYTLIKIY